jgi:hypothetical protein
MFKSNKKLEAEFVRKWEQLESAFIVKIHSKFKRTPNQR